MSRSASKAVATIAGIGAMALIMSACGSSTTPSDTSSPAAPAGSTQPAGSESMTTPMSSGGGGPVESTTQWCDYLKQTYPGISGKEVSVYTTIVDPEKTLYVNAWKTFTDCTGVVIKYDGNKDFEAQINVRIQSGNPPDLGIFPQPGLLQSVQESSGKVVPIAADAAAQVEKYWSPEWKAYGTVNGAFLGIPNSANFKSLIWYSPKTFKEKGYTVPTTWDEVIALSDKVAETGEKPWCAGIGSADATGWPATDWLEDFVLRTAGPEVYDQWVSHQVKFSDAPIAESLANVGKILKNDKYVNGGFGDSKTIASTEFTDAGVPLTTGKCTFHRQASFYEANFPKGTNVAEDGDVWAFYLPPFNDKFKNPVLGGGEFFAAFKDAPEVKAFQYFLTTPDYANIRAKGGNFLSANKGLQAENVSSPIQKLALKYLQDPNSVFRFDASDMMPAAVGSGAEWKQLTAWIGSNQDDATTLANIDAAWPAN